MPTSAAAAVGQETPATGKAAVGVAVTPGAAATGAGVAVGFGVAVGPGDGVGVAVGPGLGVGVGPGEGVGVGEGEGPPMGGVRLKDNWVHWVSCGGAAAAGLGAVGATASCLS